mmetsp:Transcript_43480/g.91351  ORF Transcript_43480/g.91351 Transcript_43480/m.91351 type:complete len:81 (-) Transcript_43480:209-451(-)
MTAILLRLVVIIQIGTFGIVSCGAGFVAVIGGVRPIPAAGVYDRLSMDGGYGEKEEEEEKESVDLCRDDLAKVHMAAASG